MRKFWNLAMLGLRLCRPRGYVGTIRALAISAIALLLVVALLVMSSATAVMSRQQSLEDARTPKEPNQIQQTAKYPLVSSFTNDWDGEVVTRVIIVNGETAREVHPPGIPRAPRPGEVFVSPAVQAALPDSALLRSALGERAVVGVIGEEGLLSPDERRVIYGLERARARSSGMTTTESFGSLAPPRVDLTGPLAFFGPLVLLSAALPLLLALIMASRLHAAVTNARFALLRSLGASRGARYLVAAAELLPFAAGGALAGTLLFTLGWQRMSGVPGTSFTFWPSDTHIGLLPVLAVPLGCLLVVLGTAGWATASSTVPSTRPSRRARQPRWWWLLPLAIALAVLSTATIGAGMDTPTRMALALGSMIVVVTIGAPAAMTVLICQASLRLSLHARSAGSLVGGRWAGDRFSSASKVATLLAAGLLSLGVTAPFVVFLEGDTKPGEAGLKAAHGYNLLVSNTTLTVRQWAALLGQRKALPYLEAQDGQGLGITVIVATCDQVRGIVSMSGCTSQTPQWITIDRQSVQGYVADFRAPVTLSERVILHRLPSTDVYAPLGETFRGAVLMKQLPRGLPLAVDGFVVNLPNGSTALTTFEAVLADLAPTAFYGNNYTDLIRQANAYVGHIQVLQISGGVGLLGLVLSLGAAAVRSAVDRSRSSAALSILGASPRMRIHAHVIGQAIPTLVCTTLAVVLTAAFWWSMAAIHSSAGVPARSYSMLLLAPAVVSLAVVLVTIPVARPEPARLRELFD